MAPELYQGVPPAPGVDPDAFRNWNAEAQERALNLLRTAAQHPYRPFYCPDVGCNGRPHDEWIWPHARANQRPPRFSDDSWLTWLLRAGRGGGKTRSGSEVTHRVARVMPRIGLIAPTGPDFRDIMVEGISGILATSPPGKMPEWEPSKKRLTWPNGAIATGFSAEEPDRLRGPQHHFVWIDEPAHMPLITDVWDTMLLGLRLGKSPKVCATTTPTPSKWMKDLSKDPLTRMVQFSTFDNIENLADTFKKVVLDKYEGTRIGRQELHGEILEDVEGSLWKIAMIIYVNEPPEELDRIVVAVDPAGSKNKRSDETGIVIVGIKGTDFYVLGDRSGKYTPNGWAAAANGAYDFYSADAIVAEKNYGGDMVRQTLENSGYGGARIKLVDSRRGKALRAEPVVALYEKRRVYHVRGTTPTLEDEQTSWVPGQGESPNRVDALVHGITELGKIRVPTEIASPDQLRHLRVAG